MRSVLFETTIDGIGRCQVVPWYAHGTYVYRFKPGTSTANCDIEMKVQFLPTLQIESYRGCLRDHEMTHFEVYLRNVPVRDKRLMEMHCDREKQTALEEIAKRRKNYQDNLASLRKRYLETLEKKFFL